jgi:uncharacterized protein YjbI with pentapeptide repeats
MAIRRRTTKGDLSSRLLAVSIAGVSLWLFGALHPFGIDANFAANVANLGAGVVSGGVIAYVVAILNSRSEQLAVERERQLREELERRQLATSLSLQNDLSGVALVDADLQGLVLSRKRFVGSVLRHVNLRGAKMDGVDLSDADLSDADLMNVDLRGAILTRSELSGARLMKSDLSGADLSGADLSQADLTGANLSGASLAGARVDRTVMTDAVVRNTDLSGVDLTGLIGYVGQNELSRQAPLPAQAYHRLSSGENESVR